MRTQRIQVAFWPIEVPLERPMRTARGESTNQQTVIVEVRDNECQLAGYGEIGCVRRAGLDASHVAREITRAMPLIESYAGEDPEDFWTRNNGSLGQCPAVQSGIDTALHDLSAKVRGLPLWRAWGLRADSVPSSSRTVSLGTVEDMTEEVLAAAGWPALKVKIASSTVIAEIETLRELTSVPFRLDGNGGLAAAWVRSNESALAAAGCELLEQPLSEHDRHDQRALYEAVAMPLFADESCHHLDDVRSCSGAFDGVNVKLAKCGGLTPARRIIATANALGLQTMVGCMGETTVGVSAAAQLLPLADLADLDSACLMTSDIASGVRVGPDGVALPEGPGIGADIDWDVVHQHHLAPWKEGRR